MRKERGVHDGIAETERPRDLRIGKRRSDVLRRSAEPSSLEKVGASTIQSRTTGLDKERNSMESL
jgi:hypothetical protein